MKAALTGTSKGWLAGDHKSNSSFAVYDQVSPLLSRLKTAVPHGLYLEGNWRVDFEVTGGRVRDFDLDNNTVFFESPMPGGIGWKYSSKATGCGCEPFYAVNVVEVISDPLDYALDWADRKVYIWLPDVDAHGRDPRSLLTIVDNSGPAIVLNQTVSTTFESVSLGFAYENGVEVIAGNDINMIGLHVHDIGSSGIVMQNTTNSQVLSCDVQQIGDTAIVFYGGGDMLTLESGNNSIVNNHLAYCGLNGIYRGEGISVTDDAVGTYIAHNLIHHVSGEGAS